jgi:glycosyltransferase involved in cell wall biosynthesis
MACGTPVIAYNRGAVPEVVRHGETGFIAHGFVELLEGIQVVKGFDPNCCRQHVARTFSWDGMVESYLSLYRSLL